MSEAKRSRFKSVKWSSVLVMVPESSYKGARAMPKVKLEGLREGMIVASAIKNGDDVLLVPAGSIITSKHLSLFGSWDIHEVDVEPCPEGPSPADALLSLSPEARTRLESELTAIFWDPIDKNAVQAAVFELALKRKAKRLHHSSH